MTPSNAARLSTLEARQQARDAMDEAQNSLLTALACHAQHADLDGVKHAFGAFLRARGVAVAPPSPPAAEGEAGTIQLPPAGAYFYDDDPPTPGPAPATITRVREALEWIATKYAGYASGKLAHDALRLLDAECETGPAPATIALPWLHPAFEGWSIVGLNHYHVNGERRLFIAMTHGRGACVKVEGPDAPLLWDELRQATAAALARPLDAERETAP